MRKNSRFNQLRIPLFLLLVCVIAYIPLSSFQFGLKNDAFIFNFPNKHFFSESLRAGVLPTWNPYLNFGFPLYADPGFSWWQPITWIFGIIGYNAYTFTIEVLFYIYMAGLGMYWLGRKLNLTRATSTVLAIMFMCSGFFIGNLQHINYVTCSAFIPWFLGTWILYQKTPKLNYWLGCCIAAYLLCTGGHPAIPLAAAIFFFIVTVTYPIFNRSENLRVYLFKQIKLWAGIFIFLLPLIISSIIVLPYFSRATAVDQQQHHLAGFTFSSFTSFLFPFGTVKNPGWFQTDVSMRNGYFSIAGFIFFLIFLLRGNKNYLQRTVLIAGFLLILLSLGGNIKVLIYDNFPILNWIKTNGEFRVFVIFSALVCTGFEIEKFFSGDSRSHFLFRRITTIVLIFSLIIIAWLAISGLGKFPLTATNFTDLIKYFIDNISFNQSLLVASLVTALCCLGYLLILKKEKTWFIMLLTAEMVINCWLLLPVTGVGRTSVAQIQKIISKYPVGFPSPDTNWDQVVFVNPEEEKIIGNTNWYTKHINHRRIEYPSLLKSSELIYQSIDTAVILNNPLAYLSNEHQQVNLSEFFPTSFTFQLSLSKPDTVIVQQNYFPGWRAEADGKKIPVMKSNAGFLAIPVKESDKKLKLEFHAFHFN